MPAMGADELTDHVVAAARAGDQAACAQVWQTLAPRVVGYLRSRGAHEPEDLTSEVFLAVFRALPDFVGGAGPLTAYTFTVAQRRLVDQWRRTGRRPDAVPWSEESDERTSASAEDLALARAESVRVQALLADLTEEQREVLALRILGDLTVEQVAQVVGRRPGAVKALQRRGLAVLRKKFHGTRTPLPVPGDDRE